VSTSLERQIRVVFMGSPAFAVPSLLGLIRSPDIDVSLVITQPDRPAGRGRKLHPPAVKAAAENAGVPVWQPETLRGSETPEHLRDIHPDLIVVVSYGEILRSSLLGVPTFGCLNVHPSLLPAYRGALPIQGPILNGDSETGISIIKLVRRMDAGPIVFQERTPLIGDETTGSLGEELSRIAGERLTDVCVKWCAGELSEIEQDESKASYTRHLTKSDAEIDWSWDSRYIERFIRAMHPWPRAWTSIDGQRLMVDPIEVGQQNDETDSLPGTLRETPEGLFVTTGDGSVSLRNVHPTGKKLMSATDWARGTHVDTGSRFDSSEVSRAPLIFRR
jgi:methionyl-tRNA formyltransferase